MFMFNDSRGKSAGGLRPGNPLGCAVIFWAMVAIVALIFLTISWPATWLGISVCVIPLLIILTPVISFHYYQKEK